MNKWTRPFELSRASAGPAAGGPALHGHYYFAFLSYSHEDSADADWLHEELEGFRVPATLAGKLTANGVIPKRLTPVFRDQHDLAASDDLTEEIRLGLTTSRALIVLCSPAAAKSKWVNAEIDGFKRLHPDGCIVAAVVSGEPLACNIPGREGEECFPPALLQKYNRRGQPTAQKAEPLAADLRDGKGGRRTGFLKIVAGILGVGLDDLVQREHLRRQRRLALITAVSLIGMIVAIGLAFAAIEARDAARDQRRQAETLIEFMVGDLKDKLEPIGRLDVLDGVGSRVLDYYKTQDTTELSDQALNQRSDALALMGRIAQARGNLDSAERFIRAALAGTEESLRRSPDDPQRMFNHAQNVFWLGEIARKSGKSDQADAAYREYKRLADGMVAADPNNLKWRTEEIYANYNIGIVEYNHRQFDDAARDFQTAMQMMEALSSIQPVSVDHQKEFALAVAWAADADRARGRLVEATNLRQRQLALLQSMSEKRSADASLRQQLIPAHLGLAMLFSERGDTEQAVAELQAAASEADRLMPVEPSNTNWKGLAASAHLELAKSLISSGKALSAAAHAATGCSLTAEVMARDPVAAQPLQTNCATVRSRLALETGNVAAAVASAKQALASARLERSDDSLKGPFKVAAAYRLLGDSLERGGDPESASAAWRTGLSVLPANAVERPLEKSERATLLERVGRRSEARALVTQLNSIGYRRVP